MKNEIGIQRVRNTSGILNRDSAVLPRYIQAELFSRQAGPQGSGIDTGATDLETDPTPCVTSGSVIMGKSFNP